MNIITVILLLTLSHKQNRLKGADYIIDLNPDSTDLIKLYDVRDDTTMYIQFDDLEETILRLNE